MVTMNQEEILKDLPDLTRNAVAHYWATRIAQRDRQKVKGQVDQGLRSAVTGGAQMDGFMLLLTQIVRRAGIREDFVFTRKKLEVPGFFRPTKEWDLLIVRDKELIAVVEVKSQAGPSFGNNFNNRTEEALGSALCLWTAFREHAYLASPQPFLGYIFMLEDCEACNRPLGVQEPHFKVLPEFVGTSYCRRYELFCRKLVLERHYTASAFITSSAADGINGMFSTPAEDLSIERFARVLLGHLSAFV